MKVHDSRHNSHLKKQKQTCYHNRINDGDTSYWQQKLLKVRQFSQ